MKVNLIAMMVAAVLVVGTVFGDYCCPPTGLAKFCNNIRGNKEILWVQGSQHGHVPPAYEGRDSVREQK